MSKFRQFYSKAKELARDDPIITSVLSNAATYGVTMAAAVVAQRRKDKAEKAKAEEEALAGETSMDKLAKDMATGNDDAAAAGMKQMAEEAEEEGDTARAEKWDALHNVWLAI